jgi:peptidoglycan/LPS O-acetylase OafA/YrhL
VSEGAVGPLGAARHLAGFDGLRAMAVLAVAAYHFFLTVSVFSNVDMLNIGLQLRVGVWVFFVVSGFLLYRPHADAHLGGGRPPGLGQYAWSRFLRIWPAYAAALLVVSFLWHTIPSSTPGGFFVQLSLTQNYVGSEITKGIGPAWSLVVEVAFYVFLPAFAAVVAWLAGRIGAWRAEVAALVSIVVFGCAWQLLSTGHGLRVVALPAFLPTFAVGMGLAVLVAHGRGRVLGVIAHRGGACWLAALMIVVVKGWVFGAEDFGGGFAFANQLGYAAVATLLVLPAVYGRAQDLPNRTLRSWPFRTLGLISYGVFLWSIPVMKAVQWDWVPNSGFHGRSGLVAIIAFAVTVAIATASWFLVERPALSLKRRLTAPTRVGSSG